MSLPPGWIRKAGMKYWIRLPDCRKKFKHYRNSGISQYGGHCQICGSDYCHEPGSVLFDDSPKEVFRHGRELEEVGLAVPQVTYILRELKERGWQCIRMPPLWKRQSGRSCRHWKWDKGKYHWRIYVKRYYTGTILSDRICDSQTESTGETGGDYTVYYFSVCKRPKFSGYLMAALFTG